MTEIWAKYIDPSGQHGLDYWHYFAKRVADLASIPKGAVVLDIGTFDGNVLFKALEKAGPMGCGIGIDIYFGGLGDGIDEASRRESSHVGFAQMDAALLGFPAETFDSVLANFVGWDCYFNFNRMEYILSDIRTPEIMRVLKPGGQLGIGLWIQQDDIDWLAEAFEKYLPEEVNTSWGNISSYGKENPEGYKTILQNSGFQDIHTHVETDPFVLPDAESWWQQMKMANSDYFQLVSDPTVLEQFKEQVLDDLQDFKSSGEIQFQKTVAYAYGTKPG
jgi:ubiquinone/menaquinone biosynthesis C-methylase UbiE